MSTLIQQGLDPRRSVVIEACAGSGKTWLLVSRLLRLLLADVAPGQILAITFTRKAAREIEARLMQWLAELSMAEDADVIDFLAERGIQGEEAVRLVPKARALYENVLGASPALTVSTFHGWFARILGGAPLSSGLAGMALEEAVSGLVAEAWADLASACARSPQEPAAQSLLWLYANLGAHNTRRLIQRFIGRRSEWRAYVLGHGGTLEEAIDSVRAAFGEGDPLDTFFVPGCVNRLRDYAALLGRNVARDQNFASAIVAALEQLPADPAFVFEQVSDVVLTSKGEPRVRTPSQAQCKRLGPEGEERLLHLHGGLCTEVLETLQALADRRAAEVNGHALHVGAALLKAMERLKRARRTLDFDDLEATVDALLHDTDTAPFLQARLDARYRHILLDEFQDTNPLQWRILRAWLDAYAASGIDPPRVFMVGDPKQSIYRFRRSDPRLFQEAAAFFTQHFGACRLLNSFTRRNAGVINRVVNAVFGAQDGIPAFPEQTTAREAWPGHVEVLPLVERQEVDLPAGLPPMRNPLLAPRADAEDQRRQEEARLVADRISAIVNRWQVGEGRRERPLAYGDILILTRRTTILAPYEAALRAAGIPFVSPGRGGLLDTLEAQDVLAVLRFLANRADSLSLVHVLRSPAFDVDDGDLLTLARHAEALHGSWWPALQEAAKDSARLQRACALLSAWLHASTVLPAHDLIDRMFHESGWVQACQRRVPPAMWPGVRANLEALLELALSVDAGRYPSLTRFVDEVQRLRRDEDESPGEGLIRAEAEGLGRVRIMTIHGAKGLEAPVVWLIDAHAPAKGLEGYQPVVDWPPGDETPRHFSLLTNLGEAGGLRRPLIEAETAALARENLNLLYVAMTRAEQALFVSGIASARSGSEPSFYTRIHDALAGCAEGAMRLGGMPVALPSATPAGGAAAVRAASLPVVQAGRRRQWVPRTEGASFGTALHAWLEASVSGLPLPAVPALVEQTARRVLAQADLQHFFDNRRWRAWGNETAYVLPDGTIGRIDRWVDDGETVWVLDYKSGHAEEAVMQDYKEQLQRYAGVLAEILPGRRTRAVLVFSSGEHVWIQ